MKIDHVQIRSYFAPPAKSYWRWTEGGRVVSWKDELTIAFREELEFVLTRLAPHGLPPLGSVLLLLAACRDNWEEPPNRRTLLHSHLGLLYGGGYSDLLTEVLTGLGRVYGLRNQLRGSLRKADLATALFEDAAGRHPPAKSVALANYFRQGLADEDLEWKPESALDDLLHDLGCLRYGLSRFDFDKLDFRLQTSLDDAPTAAPVEPLPPSSARDLIATLQDDPELGAVARLAQLLLAAVQLPRALSDPDELSIGGVSDIVNRGSLDRLLLSELANDDLTLAVRVAMNEALYLRRESPPRTPPRQRRLLLDTGLRTWGVPRVFIAAVGLAVTAKTDKNIRVEAFRTAGGDTMPVDLCSAAGLQAHLAALDHRLHPASAAIALSKFTSEDDESEADLILVTTDDTLADAEFQRHLHEGAIGGLMLASVSRDGRFELHERGLRGSKLICRAKFDLDEVLKPRPRKGKLLDASRELDLPAFLSQAEPPLRFSCAVDVARSWLVHPDNVISYTRDGRLLLWSKQLPCGARQIASGLTAEGNLLWCARRIPSDSDADLQVVVGKRSKNGLQAVTIDGRSGNVHVARLRLIGDQPCGVIGLPGAVLVIYDNLVEALSWETGESLACRSNLVLPNRQGRFFVVDSRLLGSAANSSREWHAITFQPGHGDMSIRAELVYREPLTDPLQRLLGVTDAAGCEGPVGLTAVGDVIDLATGATRFSLYGKTTHKIRPPLSLAGISRDGRRMLVRGFYDQPGQATRVAHVLMFWEGGQLVEVASADANTLEMPIFDRAKPRVIHSRYRGLGVNSDGALTLVSRRGQHWPLQHLVGLRALRFPSQPPALSRTSSLKHFQEFTTVAEFSGGFALEQAEWPDGSKAWLDGRGLLHLRSSLSSLQELTLVLCDGPIAGWLADGSVFGPNYWYGGGEPTVSASEVHQQFLQPFVRQLA